MNSRIRRLVPLVAFTLAWSAGWLATARALQTPAPADGRQVIQGPEVERFLLKAKIVTMKGLPKGVTLPRKATLELDGTQQFAVFKTIDEQKSGVTGFATGGSEIDFQDSFRTEIAAYEVDKLIGLGMVPATIERSYGSERGSLQFWVNYKMSEEDRFKQKISPPDIDAWNNLMYKVRLWDNLIYNVDRNLGNILITGDWRIILIDHSRTFRKVALLREPKALAKFSRSLLDGISKLDEKTLKEQTGKYLSAWQIKGLLQRRDLILARAKELAAEQGEANVLYP